MPTNQTEIVYIECADCGSEFNQDNAFRVPHGRICEDCYNYNYFVCDSCGNEYHNDDYGEDGECVRCFDRHNEEIQDGSFAPVFQFHKEPWENTLYQGIELEIEVPEDRSPVSHATNFKAWLEKNGIDKFLYLKGDGSLNNGYEIVSHPFTSRARHKLMDWHKVLKYLANTGAKANGGTCGMHVHVSRKDLTDKQIAKVKGFFSTNRAYISRLAGREANTYCAYELFGLDRQKQRTIRNAGGSRYYAVNLNETHNKRDTVEFRIFKGTLNFLLFMGRLQFTEAICEFVKVHGVGCIYGPKSWQEFKAWAARNGRYGKMIKLMQKEGV